MQSLQEYNPVSEKSVSEHRSRMRRRRERFHFSSRLSMAVSLLACVSGTMWQLSAVCVDYFAYAVVSEVSLVKVYNIEPPAFSLCMPYVDLVDLKALGIKKSNSPDWRNAAYQQLQESVPVSRLFTLTPELQQFVTRAWVREQDSYRILSGAKNISILKYLRDDLVCYRVTHPAQQANTGFYLKSHHVTYGKKGGGLLGLRLRKQDLRHVSRAIVFLHPVDMFPRGDRDYALFLSSDQSVFDDVQTFWTISWSRTIQLALQPPFVTNCRNSQVHGWENKEHCQHQCVNQRTLHSLGVGIFTTSITDRSLNYTVLSSESLLTNKSLEQLVDRFITECNDTCWGHNCVRVNYMPLVTSTLRDSDNIVFQVFDQNTLETRISFQAKLPFVAFLVYVLSIVGFWFGVSCLDLAESLMALVHLKKVKQKLAGTRSGKKRTGSRLPFDPSQSQYNKRRLTMFI